MSDIETWPKTPTRWEKFVCGILGHNETVVLEYRIRASVFWMDMKGHGDWLIPIFECTRCGNLKNRFQNSITEEFKEAIKPTESTRRTQ